VRGEGVPVLRVRVRLRVERGRKGPADDVERGLFEDGEPADAAWQATPFPDARTFVLEHGHILADLDHVLLQDQVQALPDALLVTTTVRLEGHPLRRVGERLRRGGRAARFVASVTELAWKQSHEVTDIFSQPQARRAFAHAVRHPRLLTPRQQRALLFLVLLSSAWLWVVGLVGMAVLLPRLAVAWNVAFSLYFAALATNLFVPVPMEPVALAGAVAVGPWLAAASAGAGKAVGAWIIFSLGPALRRVMARLEARSALTRRVLGGAERFALRYGDVALGLMLAVPFSPFDIVPVYLFSTMGLRLGRFLLAVFAGFTLRLLAVTLLGAQVLRLG
jgi:uncharacterized membrane protein YdjX (TVP38/TMEM64 family)